MFVSHFWKVCIAATISLIAFVEHLFAWICFHHWTCRELLLKMKRSNENENPGMKNAEVVIFISENKIEEMEGIEVEGGCS